MAKGKILLTAGLMLLFPNIIGHGDKKEILKAEKSNVEYLIGWPVLKFYGAYKTTYNGLEMISSPDSIDAIAKSALYDLGFSKNFGLASKKKGLIDETRAIEGCIELENKDLVARYMTKFYALENYKRLGQKNKVEKIRKEIMGEYYPTTEILKKAINFSISIKNDFDAKGLKDSWNRINELIKEEKIPVQIRYYQ